LEKERNSLSANKEFEYKAFGVAHKPAAVAVDVHVHRIVNRWGFIETKTPEQTMLQLQLKVLKKNG
jgi:endonuclease III